MKDGASVELVNGPQRPNISFNGRLLYSGSSSPEKRLEAVSRAPQTLYLVLSPLLFYGIETLEATLPDGSLILAVEQNPEIFEFSYSYFKAGNYKKTEYILLGQTSISEIVDKYSVLRIRKIIPVKLNMGYMLERKAYDAFFHETEYHIQLFWKNRITTIHMGRLWVRNIFQNLHVLGFSSPLRSIRTDKPVIVAGAGESLEHSIDLMKKYRNLFFLAAADTAVTPLMENDIKPDLVIVLESQHANIYDFYSADAFSLPAAVDLTSSPEILRKFKGPLYTFISRFDRSSLFDELESRGLLPEVIPPLGSVGIAAVYIASLISTGNILFTGIDFSFIPEKYHAAGSPTHILNMLTEKRTASNGFFSSAWSDTRKRIEDKSGRTVFTDLVMLSYADTLNELTGGGERFFNIGIFGLDTAVRLSTPEDFITVLKSPAYFSSGDFKPDKPADPDSVRTFIINQISAIDAAITSVIDFQNNRNEDSLLSEELAAGLRRIDYTWLFFPDTEILPSASASFLKRFLFSAAWFKERLQNCLLLPD